MSVVTSDVGNVPVAFFYQTAAVLIGNTVVILVQALWKRHHATCVGDYAS
jgi:hypothetical protein